MSTERGDLEVAAFAEIPQFVSATTLFQHAVADQLGLPVNDLHCLNLVSSGRAVTPTQLAERMGMTTGAVTKMLDRMQEQRLIRREPDPRDRRRVIISQLPDRLAELAELYRPMAAFLQERLAASTTDQLRFIVEFAAAAGNVALDQAALLRRNGKPHATRRSAREKHRP
ncbi:MarR family transcriptional regulator [Planomonospora parontospora subsp. parontospora]|uniref:MarR family transcriptional regulator n=2 Tax=Planomonospora parontospora TaxID=58119 RepID=A0AA37BD36_9ACTN|nr:MarR family winged helix-turn-helix transcriptional regulator [Planomonospora parontospora]GGK52196.1 MarR family transcriptional regulator [Planomonospora parontospora]GII06901.1 MarR family transcriptional regulator [Planomonospora parontospora subsp. parontospora]